MLGHRVLPSRHGQGLLGGKELLQCWEESRPSPSDGAAEWMS